MNLRKRDALLTCLGGLVVLGLLYVFLLVSPALSRQEKYKALIAEKSSQLGDMKALQVEWQKFQDARREAEDILSGRGTAFSLLTFMEELTRRIGVSDKIAYMKPLSFAENEDGLHRREGIEIRLEGLRMKELVTLLRETEYSNKLLAIERMKVEAHDRSEIRNLQVTLQVHTFTNRT
jgi:hypothetical protein